MNNKDEIRMKEILKQNFIYYKDATKDDLLLLNNGESVNFFDTESAPIFEEDIIKKYNLNKISYKDIEEFKIKPKTNPNETEEEKQARLNESLFYKLKKSGKVKTKIYCWQFGGNLSEKVFYGNNIEEFLEFINIINKAKCEEGFKIEPFKIYCHNLAWDIEFFKYYLKDNDFKNHSVIINEKTGRPQRDPDMFKCFYIVENDGAVYSANIKLEPVEHFKNGIRKTKRKFISEIEFIDSYKISNDSLKTISKNYITIDPIFTKDSDLIEYDLVRTERWKPTDENIKESFYIYSDIYILIHWYNQFIKPNYIDQGIKDPRTISQISFDLILSKSYEDGILREKYKKATDKKPISNREIYSRHYELNYIYNKAPKIAEILKSSYYGGQTTASIKYKELSATEQIKGISADITSSYPDKIVNYKLPFGKPIYKTGKYQNFIYNNENYNYHFITIAFDIFTLKEEYKDSQFGLFLKIGNIQEELYKAFGDNEEFNKLNISNNEYLTTNIINGKIIGQNKKFFINEINKSTGKMESKCIIKDKSRNKLLSQFKEHNFIITITAAEFETWSKFFKFGYFKDNSLNNGVLYVDSVSFKSETGHFKNGILYYYNLKDQFKKTNPALSLNAKKIINSFYGKNCSRRERTLKEYDLDNKKDIIRFKDKESELNYIDPNLYAIHLGAAITSWGRIQLMETAYAIGADRFIYADTDSLKFELSKEELKERLKEINLNKSDNDKLLISGINTDKKQLGLFEFEYAFNDIKTIGQKKYMYQLEEDGEFIVKCSGLPQEVRETIKEKSQFERGQEFIKGQKMKIKGGYLIADTIFNINDYILN